MKNKKKAKSLKLINEELIATGLLSVSEKDRVFVITENVEKFINDVIDNLDLKGRPLRLLKTFLKVSKGRIKFEATRKEFINNFYFENERITSKSKSEAIKDNLGKLSKWGQKNFEIVKVVEDKGMPRHWYKKHLMSSIAIYEFVLLKKLRDFVNADPNNNKTTKKVMKKFLSYLKSNN